MATVLEPQRTVQTVESNSATAPEPAPSDALLWEDIEDTGEKFPWLRLLAIGIVVGFLIGLPLVPSGDTTLANFGEIAGAYGCPFHVPAITDTRSFNVTQ